MPTKERQYKTVAMGRYLDVFHKGHEQLLKTAFKLSQRVIIGITSDQFVKTLVKPHPVEPYRARVLSVRRFLIRHHWLKRAEIHPLYDPFGPALTRPKLEAVILTPDTLSSGRKLNRLRRARDFAKLSIHVTPFALARDGKRISSTRVRRGEITRRGGTLHPRPR